MHVSICNHYTTTRTRPVTSLYPCMIGRLLHSGLSPALWGPKGDYGPRLVLSWPIYTLVCWPIPDLPHHLHYTSNSRYSTLLHIDPPCPKYTLDTPFTKQTLTDTHRHPPTNTTTIWVFLILWSVLPGCDLFYVTLCEIRETGQDFRWTQPPSDNFSIIWLLN
jgi:hypothetical protein